MPVEAFRIANGANYPLQCEVEVVRVQQGPDGYMIGARLTPQSEQPDLPVRGAD